MGFVLVCCIIYVLVLEGAFPKRCNIFPFLVTFWNVVELGLFSSVSLFWGFGVLVLVGFSGGVLSRDSSVSGWRCAFLEGPFNITYRNVEV